jgi:hypothetical protein
MPIYYNTNEELPHNDNAYADDIENRHNITLHGEYNYIHNTLIINANQYVPPNDDGDNAIVPVPPIPISINYTRYTTYIQDAIIQRLQRICIQGTHADNYSATWNSFANKLNHLLHHNANYNEIMNYMNHVN